MEISNAELRGRLFLMELILPIALTHIAGLSADPSAFIRNFMAQAQDMIERAAAAEPEEREVTEFARAAFEELGDAMDNYLAQQSHKPGRA